MTKESEENRQQKHLEQKIEEEHRKVAQEAQRQENEKKKTEEENLVYKTIVEILKTKQKLEPKKKEHPIMPDEVIKQVKIKIPFFNEKRFISIRNTLQNKGLLYKVEANKLSTAVIVK